MLARRALDRIPSSGPSSSATPPPFGARWVGETERHPRIWDVTLPGHRVVGFTPSPWPSRSTLRGAGTEGDPKGPARTSPHHPAFASHSRFARLSLIHI